MDGYTRAYYELLFQVRYDANHPVRACQLRDAQLAITLTTPPSSTQRHIEDVRSALHRAGTPVTRELVQLRESAEVGPEVFWLTVGVGAYAMKKLVEPSLEQLGQRLRDKLFGAADATRDALPATIGLEVWVEFIPDDTTVTARYWLPSGDERSEADSSLLDHFRNHPGGEVDRYWYRGVGWVDAAELHRRLDTQGCDR